MLVCGQSEARRQYSDLAPSHVLSIVTPGRSYLGPKDVAPECHLKVEFDDVDDLALPGAPTLEMVQTIVTWVATLPETARLCIHGLQGVRRAPAVGLGILASCVSPVEAAAALVPFCRHAPDPNRLVVRLFDEALEQGGALIAACEARFVVSSATLCRRVQDDSGSFDFAMLAGDDKRANQG